MRIGRALFLILAGVVAGSCSHSSQSTVIPSGPFTAIGSADRSVLPASAPMTARETAPDAIATPGPTIYVTDDNAQLWTITLGTFTLRRIGSEGARFTDITFCPGGQLYGIDFSSFYRINKKTGFTSRVGSLGVNDAVALACDSTGKLVMEGNSVPELYTIDIRTGRAQPLGRTGPFKAAGDLTWFNGVLVLAGLTSPASADSLVSLNDETGTVLKSVQLGVINLFGLASTSKDHLYGFVNQSVYRIVPADPDVKERTVLLHHFTDPRLAQIWGAAFDGNFQP